MDKILNLTQHVATPDQLEVGVFDATEEARSRLQTLLTFEKIPSCDLLGRRALNIARFASYEFLGHTKGADEEDNLHVMIGGAPYFMAPLSRVLKEHGFYPVFAFSIRKSIEITQPDGTVKKSMDFKHAGFVPACF